MSTVTTACYTIRFRLSDILTGVWVAESIRGLLNIDGPDFPLGLTQERWQLDDANTIVLLHYAVDSYKLIVHSDTHEWAENLARLIEERLEARGVTLS